MTYRIGKAQWSVSGPTACPSTDGGKREKCKRINASRGRALVRLGIGNAVIDQQIVQRSPLMRSARSASVVLAGGGSNAAAEAWPRLGSGTRTG
jgi:hypothetical protein